MTDCTNVRMRESLPEYMHGLLDLRERLLVQAHLAGCGACSSELALLEQCRSVMTVVPTVDTRRIVAALPAPPARGRRGRTAVHTTTTRTLPLRPEWRAGTRHAGWRVAAAALLMVGSLTVIIGRGGHWPVADRTVRAGSGATAGPFAPRSGEPRAGDSATLAAAGELEAVGGQFDAAREGAALSLAGGLSDLSDAALTALLGEVDAVEALPLVEPPPVRAFIVTDQSGAL